MTQSFFVHDTAVVDPGASIGEGTKIWHFSHIFPNAIIGKNCSFGQNTMVAGGVRVGNNVKVQNNVAIYEGTTIEDDVFLGPSCVLTNVSNPRSQVNRRGIYEQTTIQRGATVGANATIVCGTTLGRYSFVAAGAVVTSDVPQYAIVKGVPAQQSGWMSRHGHILDFDESGTATCPESGLQYQRFSTGHSTTVKCFDLDEESPLPADLTQGRQSYRRFKSPNSDSP